MADKHEHVALSWVEFLVLAQYAAPEPPALGEVAKTLTKLALPSHSLAQSRERASAALQHLTGRGLLARPTRPRGRALVLTESGQRALCTRLGLARAPSWIEIRDHHLTALSLGLRPGAPEVAAATRTWEDLALRVLQGERPSSAQGASLREWGNGLLLEALGLAPGSLSLDRLRMGALARAFGVEPRGTFAELAKRLVAKTLGIRIVGKATMIPAVTRRWLVGQVDHVTDEALASPATPETAMPSAAAPRVGGGAAAAMPAAEKEPSGHLGKPSVSPTGEPDLLAVVRDVIPRVGAEGRFGEEKVFVSAIWRTAERDRRVGDYSLERFKSWLLDANRRGHLALARADLVSAMDAQLVADSEIQDRGATFHFVLDPRSLETPSSARRAHVR